MGKKIENNFGKFVIFYVGGIWEGIGGNLMFYK